ncbi:YbdD/YjiX family protein [Pseudoclavibacter soli]|uniref:YbdD/YjiX family protein n=1 Tax=Pseudoclavibacter soli TaxID=452623 RepID=UPI0004248B67|nr:YbdD/YjiX family protein [Pseudoclavibacter soli]
MTEHDMPAVLVGRGRSAAPTGWWAKVVWILNGMLGANAYQNYVDHHRQVHPGEPVMSEREFWRHKAAEEDRNPSARCC